MSLLGKAIGIAATAFINKTDKQGEPYILHCLRVMNATHGDDCTKCAAVLHDVIEDCEKEGYTESHLIDCGFSVKTIQLLKLLTHNKSEDYMSYIHRLAHDKDAAEIKRRDLEDNTRVSRLKGLTKKDIDRLHKYVTAYTYLKTA